MSDHRTSGFRRSLRAYATLVRVPNLFTAPPDIVLGSALAVAAVGDVSTTSVVGLAAASTFLYAAGTTLNDYFDADEDARYRPERPIPSGSVPPAHALALGVALLVAGVAVAVAVAGTVAGAVAAALAAAVVLYDGVFKGSAVGFLVMGASRGLNVLLGATVAGSLAGLSAAEIAVPTVVSLYIAAVTFMAEGETGESSSAAVAVAVAGTGLAAVGVCVLLVVRSPSTVDAAFAAVLLAGFLAWTGSALRTAYADPSPETVGPAVGACVLALVVLDAAFAATVGVVWGFAALAFLVPAVGLSRMFDVT